MSQQFAHDVEVAPTHDQFACERMPQIVPAKVGDSCLLQDSPPRRIHIRFYRLMQQAVQVAPVTGNDIRGGKR